MSWRRVRISPAMGVALAALVLAASGGAYAASKTSTGRIKACVHRRGGGLYIAHKCARRDRQLVWNVRGLTGAAGQPGPAGPDTGAAGGGLTGSYPNPQIAPGAVGSSQFASLPGAAIYSATTQSLPNGITAIAFTNTEWDTGGMSDLAKSELVIHSPGTYLVQANVDLLYTQNAAAQLEAAITQNGNAIALAKKAATGSGGNDETVSPSGIVRLAAGDVLGLTVNQNTGAAVSSLSVKGNSGAPLAPLLEAQWLGP